MTPNVRFSVGRAASAAVLALSLVLASCDSPSGPAPVGSAAHLEIVSGNAQVAVAGTQAPQPLVVKVTDDKGQVVTGQAMVFRVVAGNGTLIGTPSLTDAAGRAEARWTLGTVARDTQKVEARAVDPATGATIVSAIFTAVATPDVPAALTKVVGDGQSAPVGAPLADSLAVKLADRYGNAVAGQTVTLAVVSGGGSVSPASRSTDSAGVARAQWTLGTRLDSAQVASASFGSLPPVTFSAAATVSGTLTRFGGDGQTGVVAHRLADSLAVRLTTGGGAPVRGATIQWTTGAGALVPATSVTDANGVARTSWLLGTAAGGQAAQAAVVGGTQTIGFTATGTADAPDHLVRIGGDGLTAPAGGVVADSLAMQALDAYGNAVPGVAITWTSPRGGGSLSPATSTTRADGVTKAQWTLGARLDSTQVARATSGSLAPVEWTATAGTGTLQIEKTSGDAQSAPVHTTLPQPLVVTIRLADGRPVAGAQVQWQIVSDPGDPAQPATLSAPYTVTDAAGQTSVQWTLGTAAGARSVRAKAQSGAEVIFTATGTAAAAEQLQIVGSAQRAGNVGSAIADSLAVRAVDHFGNGVSGVAITWSSPRGGGSFSPPTSTTGADGVAKTQWTLGARLDSAQVARATSGTLTPVEWAATAGSGTGTLLMERTAGDAQTAAVHTTLPQPLVVTVRLSDGRPVPGAQVSWQIVSDPGDPAQPASLSAPTSVTDAAGQATVQWTIGTAVGSRTAKASVQAGAEAVFSATGTAGAPEQLEVVGSTTRAGELSGAIADSLAVRVLDHYGNGVPGAAVTWTVTSGGGTISPASSQADSAGVARAQWTLGAQGNVAQAARATLGALPPVDFTATASAPANAILEKTSGDGQSATAGTTLPQPLVVTVRFADGRPLVGAAVTWAIVHDSTATPATTGRLSSTTTVTDSLGRATATWVLGTVAEAKRVSVTLAGTADSAVFQATAVAAAPRNWTVTTPPATAPAGSVIPITASIVDYLGNPVPGAWVTFAVVEGSGSVSVDSVRTDSAGQATTQWTLGASGGPQQISVTTPILPLVRRKVTATADVTVTINTPAVDAIVGDRATVKITVSSVAASGPAWVVVAGRRLDLTPQSPGVFSSTVLDLTGLPFGYLTLEAYVTVGATTYSTTRRIIHDLPPTLAVTAPYANQLIDTGTLHVAATCSDDDPAGCKSVVVQIVNGTAVTQVAAGTTSVDAMVPVTSYDGRTITVRFIATDSRGSTSTVDRVVVVQEGNDHLTVRDRVSGTLLDADDTRLLYLDSAGALVMRIRAGGTEIVAARASEHPQKGYLSPDGAVFAASPAGTMNVYDWRPGAPPFAAPVQVSTAAVSSAASLVVKGSWAIWLQARTLVRRDLTAQTNLVIATIATGADVAANGDVTYSYDGPYEIHRYRAGVDEVVGPAVTGLTKSVTATDGNLIAYSSKPAFSSSISPRYLIFLYDPASGENVLTPDGPDHASPPRDYQVAGGWTAYVARAASGQAEIWRRSPAGVIDRVTALSTDSYLIGLGTDGSILYYNGTRRFLAVPGSAAIDVGYWASGERAIWLNGRFLVLRGGYVLEIER